MRDKIFLRSGGYRAVIDRKNGASCIGLRNDAFGAALLRELPANGVRDNPYLYGMPILFPVNRISGGEFLFEGRCYRFPINEPATGCHLHGELHRTEFELLSIAEDKALFRFRATEEQPYLSFPHAFDITMEYALSEGGLSHTVTVTNRSDTSMPLFLGFHTTFNTLFTKESRPEDIRVHAAITEEYARNMEINYLPTGEKPPFDAVSEALCQGTYDPFSGKISRHYRGKGGMAISDLRRRLRAVYENDEKYGFRLIFNGGEEGYICLEPQTCLANCANSPFSREEAGFDYLKKGESKTFASRIFLEEF